MNDIRLINGKAWRFKNKAFTLIELLAVIIIIGLLAVLIIPKINGILDDSRKSVNEASAHALARYADSYYLQQKIKGFSGCTYDFGTNTNTCSEFEFSGEKPTTGSMSIKTNGDVAIAIQFGNYCYIKGYYDQNITTIDYDEETCSIFRGKVVPKEDISKHVGEENANGYVGVEAIVYLNPTNLSTVCDEAEAKKNTSKNSGCMRWYAYAEDATTYTMILDHNTTDKIAWISQEDYEQKGSQNVTPLQVGFSYGGVVGTDGLPEGTWGENGTNNRGPITLLKQLYDDTKDWVGVDPVSKNYNATWTCASVSSCSDYSGAQQYTINYSNYKARLIEAEEIATITGQTNWKISSSNFFFDGSDAGRTASSNKYAWLFDNTANCTQYGCNVQQSGTDGYWTPSLWSANSHDAWAVNYNNRLYVYAVKKDNLRGVRPVITISKSELEK